MKTIRNISERIATTDNFIAGYRNYVTDKPYRSDIKAYESNLAANVKTQIRAFRTGEWKVPEYEDRLIREHGKQRRLGVYPCEEHVMEWAMLNYLEKPLTDSYIRNSCSCVRGRGQTDFVDILSSYLRNDVEGTWYGVQLDIHHYFQWIDHTLLMMGLERKIRDEVVLRMLGIIMDSFPNGLVLGTKLSQIEANFFLVPFDHDAATLWGVKGDPEKMAYWRQRYVNWCIDTVRTQQQADELNKGIDYLGRKFDALVEQGIIYARFADNIVMFSGDKAFQHIVTEIAIMTLTRDYHVQINRSWNVRPIEPDGMDVCGYVLHHFYRHVRKRIKQDLWRQIVKLRRKGLSPEQIRLECASRIGWLIHADCRNLLRRMDVNMEERLGKKIRRNRTKIPFEGMTKEQQRSIKDFLCQINPKTNPEAAAAEEAEKVILLLEVKVERSIFEGKELCAALRFRVRSGDEWGDEYYMWTGSKILVDQIQTDFTPDDLPAPTCIREIYNNFGKKFYKFT